MTKKEPKASPHDVLFFLKGIPSDLHLNNEEMAVASIADIGLEVVAKLAEINPEFNYFQKSRLDLSLTAFVYRGNHSNTNRAIGTAYDRIEAILDAYSQVLDHHIGVSKIVLARESNKSAVGIYEYHRGGYVTAKGKSNTGDGQWNARNHLVFSNLLKHVDFLSEHPNLPPSELREDLVFALRMFRQGAKSDFHGLEFLAKFSALECLVCGPVTSGKEILLKDRLCRLFAEEDLCSESLIGGFKLLANI
jgi:hypothetical protein